MGLNTTPSGERIQIGFFGCRNAGKSSLVNAVTNQETAIVSETKGTTTDPVKKAMELLPLGPVSIIDTAGYDDEGALGEMRKNQTLKVLNRTDIAILVVDSKVGLNECDNELIAIFKEKEIPYITAFNKSDKCRKTDLKENEISLSATEKTGIEELKNMISKMVKTDIKKPLVSDLVKPVDIVVLVIPIDESAPKGRLILPQQQVIRDLLDKGAIPVVCRDSELEKTLTLLSEKPKLVICDSQVFKLTDKLVPEDIPLTSFSVLMARYKGFLDEAVEGAYCIDKLKDGDTVLIAEGCTHHRQCKDIGMVKLPNLIKKYTKKDLKFKTVSGTDFPDDLSEFALIVHCGGCMLNECEVLYRVRTAREKGVPITNYGTAIAYLNGILTRAIGKMHNAF